MAARLYGSLESTEGARIKDLFKALSIFTRHEHASYKNFEHCLARFHIIFLELNFSVAMKL